MNYKRFKRGYLITVKQWSNEVIVTRLTDKQSVTTEFSDHIQAVLAAKAL